MMKNYKKEERFFNGAIVVMALVNIAFWIGLFFLVKYAIDSFS